MLLTAMGKWRLRRDGRPPTSSVHSSWSMPLSFILNRKKEKENWCTDRNQILALLAYYYGLFVTGNKKQIIKQLKTYWKRKSGISYTKKNDAYVHRLCMETLIVVWYEMNVKELSL